MKIEKAKHKRALKVLKRCDKGSSVFLYADYWPGMRRGRRGVINEKQFFHERDSLNLLRRMLTNNIMEHQEDWGYHFPARTLNTLTYTDKSLSNTFQDVMERYYSARELLRRKDFDLILTLLTFRNEGSGIKIYSNNEIIQTSFHEIMDNVPGYDDTVSIERDIPYLNISIGNINDNQDCIRCSNKSYIAILAQYIQKSLYLCHKQLNC